MPSKPKSSAARRRSKVAAEPPVRSPEEKEHIRRLVITGEAAPCDETGKLPENATYEIVAPPAKEGEPPDVVRRRFSLI